MSNEKTEEEPTASDRFSGVILSLESSGTVYGQILAAIVLIHVNPFRLIVMVMAGLIAWIIQPLSDLVKYPVCTGTVESSVILPASAPRHMRPTFSADHPLSSARIISARRRG